MKDNEKALLGLNKREEPITLICRLIFTFINHVCFTCFLLLEEHLYDAHTFRSYKVYARPQNGQLFFVATHYYYQFCSKCSASLNAAIFIIVHFLV